MTATTPQASAETVAVMAVLSRPRVGRRKVHDMVNTMVPAFLDAPTTPEREAAEKVAREAAAQDIMVLSILDSSFPSALRGIPDPPVLLTYRGDAGALHEALAHRVAVIGTRKPTPRGSAAARKLGRQLAESGYRVVSGLALGCDAAAHFGCLEGGGVTVAVLAHGLDRVYPKANDKLAAAILEQRGCLVSEYLPGVEPAPYTFVERDRLQSGLSCAVIVAETGMRGGSMQTVQFAKRQGRAVACVVPPEAPLDSLSGNYALIQNGAVPLGGQSGPRLFDFLADVAAGDG